MKIRARLARKRDSQAAQSFQSQSKRSVISLQDNLFKKHKSCFEGLGTLKGFQLNIPIDPRVKPVVQSMRRVPVSLRGMLEKKLDELVDLDVIEKAEGPTPWISPVVVVPKPNGDLRRCVDMRQVNSALVRERHPIPTVDEILVAQSLLS